MAQQFKTALEQAKAMNQSSKELPFDREKTLKWLENYGDFVTDLAYQDFAKAKGFEPKTFDHNGRGYYNEYIQNEDFLKHVWNERNKYGEEW